MAKLKLDYSELRDSSRQATRVADALDEYASALSSRVSVPANSVPGGSNGNTSAIAARADEKARDLRSRAGRYRNLSSQISKFATNAQQTDESVAAHIKSVRQQHFEKLNILQKGMVCIYSLFNNSVGLTKLGHFMSNVHNYARAIDESVKSALQSAYRWFSTGGGRYILEGLSALVGVITTVAGVITIAASLFIGAITAPWAIVLAGIAIASGIIYSVYKAQTAVATIQDNFEAYNKSDTDPGMARYLGTGSSLLDHAKKHSVDAHDHARAAQGDIIGTTAGIVHTVSSILLKGYEPGGSSFSFKTLGAALLKDYGLQKNAETGKWIFSVGTLFKNSSGLKDISSIEGLYGTITFGSAYKSTVKAARVTKTVISDFKNITKFASGDLSWGDAFKAAGKRSGGIIKDVVSKGFEDVPDIYTKYAPEANPSLKYRNMSTTSVNALDLTNAAMGSISFPRITLSKVASGALSSGRLPTVLPGGLYTQWSGSLAPLVRTCPSTKFYSIGNVTKSIGDLMNQVHTPTINVFNRVITNAN